jgi:phage-related protein
VELGSALMRVQLGMTLGLPVSRPMPSVHPGAHEFRLRDARGIQRVFYYTKAERAIMVFHAFTKKSQATPLAEIELGRKRLKEML